MAPKLSSYSHVTSWKKADKALGEQKEKTIGNNTKLVRARNGDVYVTLHGNRVIRFTHNPPDIILSSGGHKSSTTKDRLNRYTPSGFRVVQEDYRWYLETPDGRVPFTDQISINEAQNRARRD